MFLPVLNPDHSPTGVPGQRGEHDLLAVDVGLRAEAATDVGHRDLHVLAWPAGHTAHGVAHHVRHLGRCHDLDPLPGDVEMCQHSATLERDGAVALHPI